MESIWNKTATKKEIQKSPVDAIHMYDAIIIGAGMAGILTAYYLKKAGLDVLVIEKEEVGFGKSGNTTAKITSQHGLKYTNLVKEYGFHKAFLYAQAMEEAIDEYEELIKEEQIDCEFKRCDSILYSTKDEDVLRKEVQIANTLGISARFSKRSELPFCIKGSAIFKNQACFQPLSFLYALASKLLILEHCKAFKIKKQTVYTSKGAFHAKHIIVCTNYPIINVPGFYFMRESVSRSYVLALSGCKTFQHMYYGMDENGISIRSYQDYLIVAGSSHDIGYDKKDAYKTLYAQIQKYYPKAKIEAKWSSQDCMSHDKLPFIGRYSMWTKNIYVVSGFQKWGMSTSMVAAQIIKDMILKEKNAYASLFTPQRLSLKTGKKAFLKHGIHSLKGLWKGYLYSRRENFSILLKNEAKIMELEDHKCACYKDKEGHIHKVKGRCSHMGCELTWNENEKSWDCPCHGSRFDIEGKVLDAPAIKENALSND